MHASSTQRWGDTVCIPPPRATAGIVSVWFDGFPKVEEQPPSFFTYSDESDSRWPQDDRQLQDRGCQKSRDADCRCRRGHGLPKL
ncbi:hypothetical protein F5879DRAFT_504221 [Lentinula edodes]|nr:hypothetical protein F5879DRAFT_504221 [Lentinula edodes]